MARCSLHMPEGNDDEAELVRLKIAENRFTRMAGITLATVLSFVLFSSTYHNEEIFRRSSGRNLQFFSPGLKENDLATPPPTAAPTQTQAPTALPFRWAISEKGSCTDTCTDMGRQCNQILTRAINDETKLKYVVETILGQTCVTTTSSQFDTAPRIASGGECQWNDRGSSLCSESSSLLRICCCGSLDECPVEPVEDDSAGEDPSGKGKGV